MVPSDSEAAPKRWIGIALAALLLVSFALRTWDASQGLNSNRFFDERFTFRNVSALLKHGDFQPRHAFYLSLSYLPQAAVLGASQSLYRVTRYPPFSIYKKTSDGYSPTAYWLARMVNVVYGVLSLWLIFLIGRRLYSPEAGLLAAAILAAFPRHVLSSVEFKPDILVILLVTLTFLWTLGAAFRPSLPRFLLVGFGVGLAVSTKYTGIAAAIPIIASVLAAVLVNGRRDPRQWNWLMQAGFTSILTFIVLNPYLGVVFEFIPKLVHGYAVKGVEEKSGHGVVFARQVEFLVEHHGPVLAAFVALGVVGMIWRIWRIRRPALEDASEQRLGSILLLSLLLGYSALHGLGMTLFRGQNYLPVVPFSSLAAAWALVELWRLLEARARWLAWPAVAAVAWLGIGSALLAQQWGIVYRRVVPTNFETANAALLGGLEPFGLRHLAYEKGLGVFQVSGKPRRPLLTRVDRLAALDPVFLDRADVEIFPQSRLDGPDAGFYRHRVARVAKAQIEVVDGRAFASRGEPVVVVRHPWELDGGPGQIRVRRPDQAPFLVGRLPEGLAKPGETVSLLLWVPREAAARKVDELQLDPGGRPVTVTDTGRRLSRFFRMSPRFQLTGQEIRVRIPSNPDARPRAFGLEIYRWRQPRPLAVPPAAAPAP
ncbi:MAG TPA: glycosyltransferase family 39 protein [Thermoanaerobaculia bacterium]|nr:glycosyltransferase family 39 protein [Thermoanaerobaculia bacterium]